VASIAYAGHATGPRGQTRLVNKQDYLKAALAQLRVLAAQLAIYLGYIRAGLLGGTAVGVAFVLPSFLMVLILSAAYGRFGGLPWMQGMFYGIGAAVIGIIARSAFKLTKLTLGKDKLLWGIFVVLAISTMDLTRNHGLVLLAGIVVLAVKAFPSRMQARRNLCLLFAPGTFAIVDPSHLLAQIFLYFAKAGMFVFGSGLAVLPFLYGGVVQGHHWLSDRQFVDAVAVAMITPGPVVITVAFIGYLVAGIPGATAAALGIFLPVYFVVVALAPSYKRWAKNPWINAFVRGVTAAATQARLRARW
jgi:chromate transporter